VTADPTLDEQVEALFPVGGPYGDEETKAAGRAIAALVRYLNHATWHDSSTPYPSTIDSVSHSLTSTLHHMDQLLYQLDQRLAVHEQSGRLYDDAGGDPTDWVEVWRDGAGAARSHLRDAANRLQHAASASSHLGLRDDEETNR
jgi:hypothetical protein